MDNVFKLPENVLWLMDLIEKNGFSAYIVGGCVRDIVMGRVPHDYDMTTDASPEDMIKIFEKESLRMILNGLKHGTVAVCIQGEVYEITTFRVDGEYEDHRRPGHVTFTKNIYEDLKRRDFTINAMAFNPHEGLIDSCHGKEDIEGKILRTVGNPYDRFSEDALRIMRAFRFSAQLGFSIEENTLEAAEKLGDNIKHIAVERVQEELNKIIISDVTRILELQKYGILKYIIGDSGVNMNYDDLCYNVQCAKRLDKRLDIRIAMILHMVEWKNAEILLKKLRYSNVIIRDVLHRVEGVNIDITNTLKLKKLMNRFGVLASEDILHMKEMKYEIYGNDKNLKAVIQLQKKFNDIIKNKECYCKKQLTITGNDIIKIGAEGKEVGEIMEYILEKVIEDCCLNEKGKLIIMAEEYLKIKKQKA